MTTTLYRKYRPQRFAELVGQLHVRTTLTSELESGRIAHAYLFVGPRGVGKTTAARLFAKAVNCASPDGVEPDNRCESCTSMNESRSLDLIEIDAASHTQVDHVREHILPAARTAPSTGKYKVFIIDEVHMLSASAFSALLKVLEEPPAHVIFILATTEPHRVPETIISRCQRFDFRRLGTADIVPRLGMIVKREGLLAERSVLERVARAASGSLRDAEGILGQLAGLGEKKLTGDLADLILPRSDVRVILELTDYIVSRRTLEGLHLIERLVEEGVLIGFFMGECIELFRGLLLKKIGISTALAALSAEDAKTADRLIERISVHDLERMLAVFLKREREQRTVSIPQLPLELAVVELTFDRDGGNENGVHHEETIRKEVAQRSQGNSGRRLSSSAHASSMDIVAEWPRVLAYIQTSHPSLALLLKTATPHGIVDGTLTLAFPYTFHHERLLEARTRAIVESALTAVLKQTIRVQPIIVTQKDNERSNPSPGSMDRNSASTQDVWERALRAFGSDVVGGNESAT